MLRYVFSAASICFPIAALLPLPQELDSCVLEVKRIDVSRIAFATRCVGVCADRDEDGDADNECRLSELDGGEEFYYWSCICHPSNNTKCSGVLKRFGARPQTWVVHCLQWSCLATCIAVGGSPPNPDVGNPLMLGTVAFSPVCKCPF